MKNKEGLQTMSAKKKPAAKIRGNEQTGKFQPSGKQITYNHEGEKNG